jgi:hypothetical protein
MQLSSSAQTSAGKQLQANAGRAPGAAATTADSSNNRGRQSWPHASPAATAAPHPGTGRHQGAVIWVLAQQAQRDVAQCGTKHGTASLNVQAVAAVCILMVAQVSYHLCLVLRAAQGRARHLTSQLTVEMY